jgi:very-short-patch-repair endonuclease
MPRVRRAVPNNRKKRIPPRAYRKANRNREKSSLELKVEGWLVEDGIDFKAQHAISHCHVDIFLPPRTVIELQGCYYHACPICNPSVGRDGVTKRKGDAARFRFLMSKGYDVYQIWEHEVEKEPGRVRAVLRALAAQD